MSFIRIRAMAIAKAVGVIIFAIILPSTGAIAAESIPDWELANLYGGCGWFYNPYCVVSSPHCPDYVGCIHPNPDKCHFCVTEIGEKCKDAYSYWPDLDGCDDGLRPCANNLYSPTPEGPHTKGYCVEGECVDDNWPQGEYPNCNSMQYGWCDD